MEETQSSENVTKSSGIQKIPSSGIQKIPYDEEYYFLEHKPLADNVPQPRFTHFDVNDSSEELQEEKDNDKTDMVEHLGSLGSMPPMGK